MLKGEAACELRQDFADDWKRTKGFTVPDPMPPLPSPNMVTRFSNKLQDIVFAVCGVANMSRAEILTPRRTSKFTRYRAMISLIAYDTFGKASTEIAEALHRDHTTILHSVKRGRELLQDPEWRAEYERALREL